MVEAQQTHKVTMLIIQDCNLLQFVIFVIEILMTVTMTMAMTMNVITTLCGHVGYVGGLLIKQNAKRQLLLTKCLVD